HPLTKTPPDFEIRTASMRQARSLSAPPEPFRATPRVRGLLFFASTSRRMLSTGSSVTALSFLSNLGAARFRASARPQQDGNPCKTTLTLPRLAINRALSWFEVTHNYQTTP